MPGKEADFRKGWLHWSLPAVPLQCEWGSWSKQATQDESEEASSVDVGLTHSMTKLRKKGSTGKRDFNADGKKA